MWQIISGGLGFIILVGAAVIVLRSRVAEEARNADRENVRALRDLIATRDTQLAEKTRDLELVKAEHKQLIQVSVKEMVMAWECHETSKTVAENRSLKLQLQSARDRQTLREPNES